MTEIIRGRLTAEEKAEIERLATTLAKPTPGRIALRLRRHVGTITWYMIRHGLIERRIEYPGRVRRHRQNGVVVRSFTPEEDRRLIELRLDGLVYREIAEVLTREFGEPRKMHSVQVRHIMLSAYEGGPEA